MSNSQIERILKGGGELFLQAGIKSVTMDDIAKHLGMSKKTIYQFFKDKDELVTALVKQRLQEDEDEMTEMLDKSGNVIEGMINMMKCSEEIFARANPILIHDLQKYHPEAWKQFQGFKSEVIVRTMEELLSKGIKQGYVRPEIDVKVMARMRVMQVEMGFNPSIFPAGEFNLWKVQRQLLEHFNYGICTIKGYKLLNEYKNIHEEVD
ncbi:MAG: TetR/AcrR family transcriptional regulator [Mucilaginibacter sp.]